MTAQLNMFETEGETALLLATNVKSQVDSLRKKTFAEIGDMRKEIEFLSLQLQILIEERDGVNHDKTRAINSSLRKVD